MPEKTTRPQKPKKCRNCGKRFTPTAAYPVQVFCTDQCRMEHHRHGPANRAAFTDIMRKFAKLADRDLDERLTAIEKRLTAIEGRTGK